MYRYMTNINRPSNLFCTANIVENLFMVKNIITLKPLNEIISIFTHFELCLNNLTHNFKWEKTTRICLICNLKLIKPFTNIDV